MSGLVIRGDAFLLIRDNHALTLGSHHDLVFRNLEVHHSDHFFVVAGGVQGCFINNVGKVGAGKSGRAAGDDVNIDALVQRYLAGMNFQNAFASTDVRAADDDAAVKTSGAEQRRVQYIWPISRCDQNNAIVRLKTVHFDKQLIERLFALIVTTAEARSAMAADRIDLIYKYDARCILFALLKQITNARGPDTDKHLDEIRTGDREKWYVRLAGNGLGKQCLTSSRRSHHQNTLRNLAAEFLEFLRILEKFDDLLKLFFGFFDTCDFLKRHPFLLIIK